MADETPQMPDFKKMVETFFEGLSINIGIKAAVFFKDSFNKGGFTDFSFIPWVRRKDTLAHGLMNLSGKLKESIHVAVATKDRVEVEAGRGVPYAQIHNWGGTITVRVTEKMRRYFWYMFKQTGSEKYKWMALTKKEVITIKIPKRQYIGDSQALVKEINEYIIKKMQQAQANAFK